MEYLDDCSTIIRRVARKVAAVEGELVCLEMISPQGYSFWMGRLVYDSIPPLELSFRSPIEFIQKSHDGT